MKIKVLIVANACNECQKISFTTDRCKVRCSNCGSKSSFEEIDVQEIEFNVPPGVENFEVV